MFVYWASTERRIAKYGGLQRRTISRSSPRTVTSTHLSFLHGAPPKAIWLRHGNASTEALESIMRQSAERIGGFLKDREAALLILGRE